MTALLEYLDPDCSIRVYQSFKVIKGPLMGPPGAPWGQGQYSPVDPPCGRPWPLKLQLYFNILSL